MPRLNGYGHSFSNRAESRHGQRDFYRRSAKPSRLVQLWDKNEHVLDETWPANRRDRVDDLIPNFKHRSRIRQPADCLINLKALLAKAESLGGFFEMSTYGYLRVALLENQLAERIRPVLQVHGAPRDTTEFQDDRFGKVMYIDHDSRLERTVDSGTHKVDSAKDPNSGLAISRKSRSVPVRDSPATKRRSSTVILEQLGSARLTCRRQCNQIINHQASAQAGNACRRLQYCDQIVQLTADKRWDPVGGTPDT